MLKAFQQVKQDLKEIIYWDALTHNKTEYHIGMSEKGIAGLTLGETYDMFVLVVSKHFKSPKMIHDPDRVAESRKQLLEYLEGKRTSFDLPLDLRGTPFQQSVWSALIQIPFGETSSYGEIAKEIGNEKAVRAVGAACGANPVPIIVPCHRVLGRNGAMTGFSASGGVGRKEILLRHEGIGKKK